MVIDKVKRYGVFGAAVLSLIALAANVFLVSMGGQANPARAQAPADAPHTIAVVGQGQVAVKPDMAVLRLGANGHAASIGEAMSQVNKTIDRMVKALQANGIAEQDIQTQGLSAGPQYGSQPVPGVKTPPNIVGYQASEQLQVKVRDLSKIGQTIEGVAAAAGDNFQMQGIQFAVADPTPLQSKARELAIANARAKAQELARISGVSIGAIVTLSEDQGALPVAPVGMGVQSAPAAISPGEMNIVSTVHVTYAIQ